MNTSAILILVAVIYALFMLGVVFFIRLRKRGVFKQTVDPKPIQPIKENEREDK